MRRRGFTLLELTVVIGIIAVLASILFPVFARSREAARQSTCASNLTQIGQALHMYAHNYDGRFPKKDNFFGPIYPYAMCQDVFRCPSDPDEHAWVFKPRAAGAAASPFGETRIAVRADSSYVYRGGLTNEDPGDTVISGEASVWHGSAANVLYVAGYVKGIPADVYKPVVNPPKKPPYYPPYGPPAPPGAAPMPGPPGPIPPPTGPPTGTPPGPPQPMPMPAGPPPQ